MTPNTTPEKPEWFELTDGDSSSAQVKKVNKKLPAIAVLVTGAVIATGAFFANASESHRADDQFDQTNFQPGQPADGGALALGDTSTANLQTPPKGPRPHVDASGVPLPPPGGVDGDREDDDHDFGDRPRPDGDRHERGERDDHDGRGGSAPKIPTATATTAAKGA